MAILCLRVHSDAAVMTMKMYDKYHSKTDMLWGLNRQLTQLSNFDGTTSLSQLYFQMIKVVFDA
jgi:hypothetical protein